MGWAKLPVGTEILVKKDAGFSWDAEKGVFLDKSGKAVLPAPDTYQIILPGQPGHSGTPVPKGSLHSSQPSANSVTSPASAAKSSATNAVSNDGSVSNYVPRGASSVSSSSASPEKPNLERMSISEETPIPANLPPKVPKTTLASTSHTEINALQEVMLSSVKKTKALSSDLKAGKLTPAVYKQKIELEVQRVLVNFKEKLQLRRKAVLQNSYYVHILDEQIKLCDQFVLILGQTKNSARDVATLQIESRQLEPIEKAASLIPVKYQTLDTH